MNWLSGYKTYIAGWGIVILSALLFVSMALGGLDRETAHATVDQVADLADKTQVLVNGLLGFGLVALRSAVANGK
ncbi:MAG: hypothetical protein GHCLOJNM_03051 [bacterium]|nr:hypothetical protein [bacterium]